MSQFSSSDMQQGYPDKAKRSTRILALMGVGGSNPLYPTIRINNLQSIRQDEHAPLLMQGCHLGRQLRPLLVPVETAVGVYQLPSAVGRHRWDLNSSPYPPQQTQPTSAHPNMSCCSRLLPDQKAETMIGFLH
jgi:hypothetical protein